MTTATTETPPAPSKKQAPAGRKKVSAVLVKQAAEIVKNPPEGGLVYGRVPCYCKHPKEDHRGDEHAGGVIGTACRKYRPNAAYELALRAVMLDDMNTADLLQAGETARKLIHDRHKAPNGGSSLGASDIDACPASLSYRENPPEGFVPDEVDMTPALLGTVIHDGVEEATNDVEPWVETEGVAVLPGLDRPSHYDGRNPIMAEVRDTKTASSYVWDLVTTLDTGKPGHWKQIMLYAYASILAGHEVRTVSLRYIKRGAKNRDDAKNFRMAYDEKMALDALDTLLGYAMRIEAGEHLPRDPERRGPNKDPLCENCFARSHCWNVPQAKALGRNSVSLTIMGVGPTEAANERVLAAKKRVSSYNSLIEKADDFLKELMEDIPVGEPQGNLRMSATDISKVNTSAYLKKILENLSLPEGERLPLDQIEVPMTEYTSRRISVVDKKKPIPGVVTMPKGATFTTDGILGLPEPEDVVSVMPEITAIPHEQPVDIVDAVIEEERA